MKPTEIDDTPLDEQIYKTVAPKPKPWTVNFKNPTPVVSNVVQAKGQQQQKQQLLQQQQQQSLLQQKRQLAIRPSISGTGESLSFYYR